MACRSGNPMSRRACNASYRGQHPPLGARFAAQRGTRSHLRRPPPNEGRRWSPELPCRPALWTRTRMRCCWGWGYVTPNGWPTFGREHARGRLQLAGVLVQRRHNRDDLSLKVQLLAPKGGLSRRVGLPGAPPVGCKRHTSRRGLSPGSREPGCVPTPWRGGKAVVARRTASSVKAAAGLAYSAPKTASWVIRMREREGVCVCTGSAGRWTSTRGTRQTWSNPSPTSSRSPVSLAAVQSRSSNRSSSSRLTLVLKDIAAAAGALQRHVVRRRPRELPGGRERCIRVRVCVCA
jgi:hypothetical protein